MGLGFRDMFGLQCLNEAAMLLAQHLWGKGTDQQGVPAGRREEGTEEGVCMGKRAWAGMLSMN